MAGTAIVWVAEGTWPACVDAARTWVPDGDDIVLLHVSGGELAAAHGALAGLLGRGRRGPEAVSTPCPRRPSPHCWSGRRSGWAGRRGSSSGTAGSSVRWWRRPTGLRC